MEANTNKVLLKEGDDYYIEGGLMVFTSAYHVKRGFCCQNNCLHCPYHAAKEKPKKAKSQ